MSYWQGILCKICERLEFSYINKKYILIVPLQDQYEGQYVRKTAQNTLCTIIVLYTGVVFTTIIFLIVWEQSALLYSTGEVMQAVPVTDVWTTVGEALCNSCWTGERLQKVTDILPTCPLTPTVPISAVTVAEFQQSICNTEMAPDPPHTHTDT
jgi:hypothetical protein